jgi:tetratricopeptide (TPR) repeat protein
VVAPPPIPPPPAPAAAPAPASARAGHGQEAIAKLVTETDVYMKYGLHEKALEHLKKVLALDPDNLEAHEKTLQLRALRKDAAGAAEAAVRAARIALARGLEDRARAAMDRLREIAPDHPELAALGGAVHPAIEEEVVVLDGEEDLILEVEPPAEEVDDIAIAAAGSPVDEIVDEEPAVAIVAAPPAAPPAPGAGASPAKPPVPPSAPVPVVAPPRAVPASPVPASAAPPRAEPPRVAPFRAEPPRVAPARATPPRVAPSVPVASVPIASIPIASTPPPARVPPPPPPPDEGEEDLEDELAEIEFFVQQGLHDEAHEALQNLLAFYPAHLKVRARLTELERTLAPPPAAQPLATATPAAVLPEPPVEETFDIARELAEELGTSSSALPATDEFQYSVADVFSQFKKGVAETVKAEDSATHYDLGIAYKEMGLLDDALHEFEVAMSGKARKKEIDCLTMIAMCRTEKGDAAGAIQAYQRALRSDYVTPEAARAVHYEIAVAYEVAGDPEAALFYLQRVLKADAGYRDAKAIVARLGGGPGRQPPSAGNPRPAQNESSAPGADRNGPKKNIGFV